MERGMKIHTATVGLLCLTTLTIGGCVASSTYDTAVADLEATKGELKVARTQSELLTEQISELEQRNNGLARQMEAALSALQQAEQEMDAERKARIERLSKLNHTIAQLTAQQNGLKYVLKRATEEEARLQSTVDRYNPPLGEADGVSASFLPPPNAPTNEQAGTALAPSAPAPVPNAPAPQQTVTTQAAPIPANPKQQPAGKQTAAPVEEGWLPAIKGWIVSLWRSIFS
jgi:Skp family chaperone for outer membrane proteins